MNVGSRSPAADFNLGSQLGQNTIECLGTLVAETSRVSWWQLITLSSAIGLSLVGGVGGLAVLDVRPRPPSDDVWPRPPSHTGSGTGYGSNRPAIDQPAIDQPGIDRPGIDRPGIDRPGIDEPAIDQPGGDLQIGPLRFVGSPIEPAEAASTEEAVELDLVLEGGIRIGPATLATTFSEEEVASRAPSFDDVLHLESGVRIGPLVLTATLASATLPPVSVAANQPGVGSASSQTTRPPRLRRLASNRGRTHSHRRPRATGASVPRLHANPGRHTILVARRFMASGEPFQGSCYRFLSEVFERAGHNGWRHRQIVYRAERDGPYANPAAIRPGDWLYIVNDPHSTPVGTHSVLFLGWQDRARGIAHTISHAGWYAQGAGRERTYDVSRTYRIIRPITAG